MAGFAYQHFVNFDGKIIEAIVTNGAYFVSNWIQEIFYFHERNTNTIVGLDIEWRPNTVAGGVPNRSATLQLCVDDKCLIIQLLYLDQIPPILREFLASNRFTFVGVGVERDVIKLRDDHGLVCNQIADIRDVAKEIWPGRFSCSPGLKELSLEVAGLAMEKPPDITRSDWASRNLNYDQVQYACIDAYASCKIGAMILLN